MAKRGGTKHLKLLAASKVVKTGRKQRVWLQRALPGKHSIASAVPLSFVLKELGVSDTNRESKVILNELTVKLDGIVTTELKHPIGLMDIISVGDKKWRALYDEKGRLVFAETGNPNVKLCRVERKFRSKGGKIQLSLHDGRTVVDFSCNVGDSITISIPDGKAKACNPLKEGAACIIVGGKHVGKTGKIEEIIPGSATRIPEVKCKIGNETYTTLKSYIFPIGDQKF